MTPPRQRRFRCPRLSCLGRFRCPRLSRQHVAVALILTLIGWAIWFFGDWRQAWTPSDLPQLRSPNNTIRLLHLFPGQGRQRIEGILEVASFADNPSYEALSYTWGDPAVVKDITVDGKRLGVTANLWNALHDVRSPSVARTMWIDAVCIDQTSTEEKNQQVPLMSLIYGRAKGVAISIGSYTPPRWVQQSEPSRWRDGWAAEMTNKYWGSTSYWLYLLASQEYWKRCWIVQEVGMARSIQVYSGPTVIPWERFVELMREYAAGSGYAPAERILALDDLRTSMYRDGETYELGRLLYAFRDSFCSVSLDKVFAFAGMAIDCEGDCLDIDYGASPTSVYEAVISFQNRSTYRAVDKEIDMVHLAGLTRQLLSRKQVQVVKDLGRPGTLYDPDSWMYWGCGDDRIRTCAQNGNATLNLLFLDFITGIFRKKHLKSTALWLPADPEQDWFPDGSSVEGIRARGAIVGEVKAIGPSYTSYLSDPAAPRRWTAYLLEHVAEVDRGKSIGLNARLSTLLGPGADFSLRNVVPLKKYAGTKDPGSRLFLGTGVTMGLVPSNAEVGDILCQFWFSNAVAVLRRTAAGGYDVVGRAVMVRDGNKADWDVPTDRGLFQPSSLASVVLSLDIETLTRLSLDTVILPASEEDESRMGVQWQDEEVAPKGGVSRFDLRR